MTGPPVPSSSTLRPLRDLQRINAAFSGLTGAAMVATSGWLSRQVDLARPAVAVLGIALIGWSVLLASLAVQPAQRLIPLGRLVAAGDGAWVIGSCLLILAGDLTGVGVTLVVAAATVVAGFATEGVVLDLRASRRALSDRNDGCRAAHQASAAVSRSASASRASSASRSR